MRTFCRTLKTAPEAWIPDAWIIEDELRRERAEKDRPYLELPLSVPETYSDGPAPADDSCSRGVVIIPL
jgi:hypothetical protein